ncbi:MAG: NAD(P)-dependent oxidoreductase [Desulfurococcales archaeon]|nr:NAD(P)-dependent oxidoreductase [Desulfurococcales archaeon]
MRCVLVGGIGYLGVNLLKHAREYGIETVVVSRVRSAEKRPRLHDLARSLASNTIFVRDRITWDVIAEANGDCVVHLAGKPGGPRHIQYEAHVGLAEESMKGAMQNGAFYIYISSIAVTADASRDPPWSRVVEEEPHLSGGHSSVVWQTYHSETKALGEEKVTGYKYNWLILRPGLIIGDHAYHMEWKLLKAMAKLKIYPYTKAPVSTAETLSRLIFGVEQHGLKNKWINAIEPGKTLQDYKDRVCGETCRAIDTTTLTGMGSLMPRTSKLRLAWSILRKNYTYDTKYREQLDQL